MTQPFSIPTILRMIPTEVLEQFFKKLGHATLSIDWRNLRSWDIRPILCAIAQFDMKQLLTLENLLHEVFDLASDSGMIALREAGGQGLFLRVPKSSNPYCQAMLAWLHAPEIFDRALLLQQVDHLGEWHTRMGLPKVEPKSSDDVLGQFASAISALLHRRRNLAGRCTVEHMRRADGTDYFLAYVDGAPTIRLWHDESGHLAPKVIRPVVEIVFAYNRTHGELETFAKTSPDLRSKLENLFCEIMLGQKVEASDPRKIIYNLNALKEGPSRLTTDPNDGVVVRVWQIRLSLRNSRRRIVLVADRSGSREDIFVMLRECIDRERLPLSVLNVTGAEFRFDFQPVDGRQQEPVSFGLISPDRCTLRNQRPGNVELVRKYLRQWRIAVG
jgi:hypothetical protein